MKSNLFMIFVAAYLLTSNAEAISESNYKDPQDKQPSYSLDEGNSLIKMAEKKFGRLTDADNILFAAVADGKQAVYMEGGQKDKPEDANNWGERRTINANRIEWLCRDKQAKELVTDNGIWVIGAKIKGTVDLSFAEISFPLCFQECVFNKEICMLYSRIKVLSLIGSHTGSIRADEIMVEGSVLLRDGFKANGEVWFPGAAIGGDFDCENGEFINEGGRAILAKRMDVKGSVLLRNGFKANGEVCFPGAAIGGDFDCNSGEFINKGGIAISADRMDVKGGIFLRDGFKANGEVRFPEAAIGGDFDCMKGEFINKGGRAISADGMDVKGCVFLGDGFKANGEVRFPGASIGGQFVCDRGEFINEGGKAISAAGMDVKGCVFLRDGFKANGEVYFLGAEIAGDFGCIKGEFINEGGKAISADGIDVKGGVFLGDGMDVKGCVFLGDGFKANGEVRFPGVAIGRDFDCENGEFINEGNAAIVADGMAVKGNVFLRKGFGVEGWVSLVGVTVGRHFLWSDVNHPEKTMLDLRNARAGVLWDDEKSWPADGNLFLDGFVYENIGDDAPKDAKSRIEWIQRQYDPNKKVPQFRPQPYEQLATVLLITKNKDRIRWGPKLSTNEFVWYRIFGPIIGYGYKPLNDLRWIGGFILLGFGLFGIGFIKDVIVPTEKDAYVPGKRRQLRKGYPKFSFFGALFYSIEMFVPVLDLHMKKYWRPDANKSGKILRFIPVRGDFIRGYMWVHIILGWILTTLLIVGLTGLVK